jgi:hypothetical protein
VYLGSYYYDYAYRYDYGLLLLFSVFNYAYDLEIGGNECKLFGSGRASYFFYNIGSILISGS